MDNIRELMKYDPETGVCIWKKRKGDSPDVKCFNARFAGKEMGSINPGPKGQLYKRARIKGRNYYLHRLIWVYMTGERPSSCIDHINGDGLDNRFSNLRLATHAQNAANSKAKVTNLLGVKGVNRQKGRRSKPYRAVIRTEGTTKSLGYYKTHEEANVAYLKAAKEIHGEFANAG